MDPINDIERHPKYYDVSCFPQCLCGGCAKCCARRAPTYLWVQFSGVANKFMPDPPCTLCAEYNTNEFPVKLQEECYWSSDHYGMTGGEVGDLPCCETKECEIEVYLDCDTDGGGDYWTLDVVLHLWGEDVATFNTKVYGAWPLDCALEWVGEPLPLVGGTGGVCDFTSGPAIAYVSGTEP